MRVFFDSEFVDDGVTIDLISLAAVREDGATFYAVSTEYDRKKAQDHPFVGKYVLPSVDKAVSEVRAKLWTRQQIRLSFQHFSECRLYPGDKAQEPEFWADYGSYDWVALCQLFGTMLDLPDKWPRFVRDVQQFRKSVGMEKFNITKDRGHDALLDALEVQARWKHITENSVPAKMIQVGH
jgi:hypothetical protein